MRRRGVASISASGWPSASGRAPAEAVRLTRSGSWRTTTLGNRSTVDPDRASSFCRSWSSNHRRGARWIAPSTSTTTVRPVSSPTRVEVAATTGGIDPNGLPNRCRQPVAPAQTREVDLAERFGAHRQVIESGQQRRAMSRAPAGLDDHPHRVDREQALLDRGSQEADRRASSSERAGRQHQCRREVVSAPGAIDRCVVPVDDVVQANRQIDSRLRHSGWREDVDLVTPPAVQAGQLSDCEGREHGPWPAVDQRCVAGVAAGQWSVVHNDRSSAARPTSGCEPGLDLRPRASECRKLSSAEGARPGVGDCGERRSSGRGEHAQPLRTETCVAARLAIWWTDVRSVHNRAAAGWGR